MIAIVFKAFRIYLIKYDLLEELDVARILKKNSNVVSILCCARHSKRLCRTYVLTVITHNANDYIPLHYVTVCFFYRIISTLCLIGNAKKINILK